MTEKLKAITPVLIFIIIIMVVIGLIYDGLNNPTYEYHLITTEIETNKNTPVNYTAIYWEQKKSQKILKYAYFTTIEGLEAFKKQLISE
jgi:LPS O-antigen subunit length determinant protein (WzzB/FepE family)